MVAGSRRFLCVRSRPKMEAVLGHSHTCLGATLIFNDSSVVMTRVVVCSVSRTSFRCLVMMHAHAFC